MPCLDENDVVAFLQGTLDGNRGDEVRAHLDSCPSCLELISLLGQTSLVAETPAAERAGDADPEPTSSRTGAPPADLSPGSTVGRYQILEARGSGGMGVVFAARDPKLGRDVAIKLVKPDVRQLAGEQGQLRLISEAQAMARLTHPNVLTVYDIGAHDDQIFVAAELVEGSTLDEWLSGERSWRQIVELFIQAGRGLEAAHRAGLVHRDFKPKNVLIGDDERARVFDFGLVRFEHGHDSSESRPKMIGTPAYMSPEQFRGEPGDHRSDQFGFCVALAEALTGERPFPGKTIEEINKSVDRGVAPERLQHRNIPAWLRKVLATGLSSDAGDRFESMSALIDAINAGIGRRRRYMLASAAAAAVVVAAGAGLTGYLWAGTDSEDPCAKVVEPLDGIWDARRRAAVEHAFTATGTTFAGDSWQQVSAMLDDYGRDLTAHRRTACSAARADNNQSPETHNRQLNCLHQRKLVFAALIDRFAEADKTTVIDAVQAAGALPDLELCSRADALERMQFPDSAELRQEVTTAWQQLANASGLSDAGQLAAAADMAEAALASARQSGFRPLEAEALYELGQLRVMRGEIDQGVELLEEATWTAQSGGHDQLVAAASARVLIVTGYLQADFDKSRSWNRLARAAAERIAMPRTDAAVSRATGMVLLTAGKFDEAEAELERAHQLSEQIYGAKHPMVAIALNDLANLHYQRGRLAEAEKAQRETVAIFRATVGPHHPNTGLALNNLGNTLADLGRYQEAANTYQESLDIREGALGSDHPDVGQTLNNMSGMWFLMGDYQRADRDLNRALAIRRAHLGEDHPSVASTLSNLGEIAHAAGRWEAARDYHQRALAIRSARLGDAHPETAISMYNLGTSSLAQGQLDDAESWCGRTEAALTESDSNDPVFRAQVITCLGRIDLARNRADDARERLEMALSLYPTEGAEPGSMAETRFALARALATHQPTPGRAIELAESAVNLFRRAGVPYRGALREAEGWLAERGIEVPSIERE